METEVTVMTAAEIDRTARGAEKKRKKKKHRLRRLILWLLLILLIAGGGYLGYTRLREDYTVTYDGYTASRGTISNSLSFSGSLSLIDNQTYTSSQSATVRAVYVQAGDQVKAGDRLVRLSTGEILEADFDGRVNRVDVEKGDQVKSGANLVQVADFQHLKASLRVDEYDIASVHVGDRCVVYATATGRQFPSSISAIDYISASQGSVAYYTATVYVDMGDADNVYPGMQVTISVPKEEAADVVILKMDALSFSDTNSAFVYMQDEGGEMQRVPLKVGVSNGNYVEITEGLSEGDTVYAVAAKKEEAGGLSGLLSGVFGGTRVNGTGAQRTQNWGGGNNNTRNNGNTPRR
ncbi:MAG: HlyD family efflux transporter periplasmic adaptor subunit [Clostridia bacterium]|nr:HlyD family efflux transporter periplasmic adaptor subunit [Clostridia bacterium]